MSVVLISQSGESVPSLWTSVVWVRKRQTEISHLHKYSDPSFIFLVRSHSAIHCGLLDSEQNSINAVSNFAFYIKHIRSVSECPVSEFPVSECLVF